MMTASCDFTHPHQKLALVTTAHLAEPSTQNPSCRNYAAHPQACNAATLWPQRRRPVPIPPPVVFARRLRLLPQRGVVFMSLPAAEQPRWTLDTGLLAVLCTYM